MASALIQMSCPEIRNALIHGMDSGAYDDSMSDTDGRKRGSDQDDAERAQMKKRRKQSNPIRITTEESDAKMDDPSNEINAKNTSLDINGLDKPAEKKTLNSPLSEDIVDASTNSYRTSLPGKENVLDNNIKNITMDSAFPLNLSNMKSSSKEILDQHSDDKHWYKGRGLFPLPPLDPLQVKSHFFQNNVLLPPQSPTMTLPNLKRIMVGNNEIPMNPAHRIFNPEAFCDLCNKEFCNKYFLKTHRANKHGIYSDNTGSSLMENLCSLPITNYFSSVNNSSNNNNNNNNSSLNGSSPISPLIGKKSVQPLSSVPIKSHGGSMRAFCNICQREFCNKYFVRRHKAKIHGIIDAQSDESQDQKSDSTTVDLNMPGPSSSKVAGQSTKDSLELSEEKISIKRELEYESEDAYNSQSSLKYLATTWNNEELRDSSNSPDRLKKSGSVGSRPLTYCEGCNKEFCSKYFIRVHRDKCLGAVTQKKDDSQTPVNLTESGDSPLNLILREINKEPENDSLLCKICFKNFSDANSLLSHCELEHDDKCYDKCKNIPGIIQDKPPVNNQGVPSISDASSDSISDSQMETNPILSDVQKMHSMISKMNNSGAKDYSFCDLCQKDLVQTSLLENHIIKDHAALLEEIGNSFDEENVCLNPEPSKYEEDRSPKTNSFINILEDAISDQQCADPKLLKNGSVNSDALSNGNGDRQALNTPTSSFCDICKKELCNKYFMKTHMQRMHGISIENGAQLGGVMCEICNKELCSKYFLRVHKQNSHGIVDENFLPQIGGNDLKFPPITDFSIKTSDTVEGAGNHHRYFSHFNEICPICGRRFRSAKWLKAHLINDHGDEGKDKWREIHSMTSHRNIDKSASDASKKVEYSPLYMANLPVAGSEQEAADLRTATSELFQSELCSVDKQNDLVTSILTKNNSKLYKCSYCSFSTPILALLFIHERNHVSGSNEALRCPICLVVCENSEFLDKHICCHNQKTESSIGEEKETLSRYSTPIDYSSNDLAATETSPMKQSFEETILSEEKERSSYVQGQVSLKCHKCCFLAHDFDSFSKHAKDEHSIDMTDSESVDLISEVLVKSSQHSSVPASFAAPGASGNFIMQPFLVEETTDSTSTFLSSIIFLPVRDKIKKVVTASFKLTPT